MGDSVVKVDSELLGRVEKFVRERKFEYSSNKQVVNLAIIEFLKEKSLENSSKKEGNKKGAAIAIDVRNGEVLAMASYPGFDPTLMSMGVTSEDLKEMINSPFRPFYNKTIQDQISAGR